MARRRGGFDPRQPRDRRGRWSRIRGQAPGRGLAGQGGYRAGRGGIGGNTAAFGRHAVRGAPGSLPLPSRGRRIGRGAFTTGVSAAPSVALAFTGVTNPAVGAVAFGGTMAYRRRQQRRRGETGLRSIYTGRRLN